MNAEGSLKVAGCALHASATQVYLVNFLTYKYTHHAHNFLNLDCSCGHFWKV